MKYFLLLLVCCVSSSFAGRAKAPICEYAMDIGVIADTSKSIGRRHLPKLRKVLKKTVDMVGISADGSHMGLITFSRDAELLFSFTDTAYQTPAAAKQKIDEIKDLKFSTRTDKALIMANDELFTEAGGDRPDIPNVLLVLTDGRPTPRKGYKGFDKTVPPLLAKGVRITAVGIGKKEIKEEVLREIAGEGGYTVNVDNFGELLKELKTIIQKLCAVDGGYTTWSNWGECSANCGGGKRTRSRTCTNPSPKNGGKNCDDLGAAEETEPCNEQECPVDGGYTTWSNWGECSANCGGGKRTRSRTCTNPSPKNGGKNCDVLGAAEETEPCNEQECPPPCKNALDLAVIADISKSVKMQNLPKLKEAIKTIADKFEISNDGTHMALITFAENAKLEFTFADTQYQNPAAAKQKIDEINKLILWTRTDKALTMANNRVFTPAGGDRPDKPNALLVFTDGRPTPNGGEGVYQGFDVTVPPLEAKDVKITAVGVGPKIDTAVLREIAGENGNVFEVNNFDALLEKLEKIKELSCGR